MSTRDVTDDELQQAQSLGWAARKAGWDYLMQRVLPDGRGIYLMMWSFGGLCLAIGPKGSRSLDDEWNYQAEQSKAAWRAAIGWDGEGEPEGWYRHPASGRRRPDGDPAREFVRP